MTGVGRAGEHRAGTPQTRRPGGDGACAHVQAPRRQLHTDAPIVPPAWCGSADPAKDKAMRTALQQGVKTKEWAPPSFRAPFLPIGDPRAREE